jgi:tryptophan-rich sensory protein
MGVAAFLVWKKKSRAPKPLRKKINTALFIFGGQLVLNSLWSIIFFGLKNPLASFIEIIFLWVAILATIIAFARVSKPAAWLLVPYILWVSFAGFLNYSLWQLNKVSPEDSVFCTLEAKLCPDGSYVGRTAPDCEFSPCPDVTSGWESYTDDEAGVSFKYPALLTTEYIRVFDWPPQVRVTDDYPECIEAGSVIDRAGRTETRTIGNTSYCVTRITEGAAGSIYDQYAYAFPISGKTAIFTFSLRSVQCGNYDDPEKLACEKERASFETDRVIDGIVDSMAWSLVVR